MSSTHSRGYARDQQMKPFALMRQNAAAHFRLRASSWGMATINLCVGLVLTANPTALTTSPGASVYFAHLVWFMSPESWRNLFIMIGGLRLGALFVNGTFQPIWWTAHVRMAMSFVSLIVWTQFAISLFASGILTIGCVLYTAMVFAEAYNTKSAATDAKQKRDGEFG